MKKYRKNKKLAIYKTNNPFTRRVKNGK